MTTSASRAQPSRRQVGAALGAGLATAAFLPARAAARRSGVCHVGVGARILTLTFGAAGSQFEDLGEPTLAPAPVQFGWRHPKLDRLYVACSNSRTGAEGRHFLAAYTVAASGALAPHGTPTVLAARPIHLSVDRSGDCALVAYNNPAGVTVHRLLPDGAIGAEEPQAAGLRFGVYPHQVRVSPSDRSVLVCARGNDASAATKEDPGALQLYRFEGRQLTNQQSVSPGGGLDFRPRHADFHPSGRWAYVALESENQLQTYALDGDRWSEAPLSSLSTLDPSRLRRPGQQASEIAVRPDGRTLYVTNRGSSTEEVAGQKVVVGENSVAVFSIAPRSGTPHLIQSIDTEGVTPRSMDVSRDGRWLVVGNMRPALVRRGEQAAAAPAGVTLYAIAPDGRLEPVAKHDIAVGMDSVFWVGAWR